MKRYALLSFVVVFSWPSVAQDKKADDKEALLILDRMSQMISGLNGCTFSLQTSTDRLYKGVVYTELNNNVVHMSSPNKLMVDVKGDKGHRSYYYNGKTVTYYHFGENNYAKVDAPATVLATFDTLSSQYDINFPAADFFYPDFTDDLLASTDKIEFEGRKQVDGMECFHIVASGKLINVQMWIANDAVMLPKKVVINYYDGKLVQRYEGDFSEWNLNPQLPSLLFEFLPPPGASQIYMLPNTIRPIK